MNPAQENSDPGSRPPHPKDLFLEALAIPADQRRAFLNVKCAGDSALRERVDALLRAYDEASGFLERPAAGHSAPTIASPSATSGPHDSRMVAGGERAGTMIGPYKLLEQIGEGGFGVVWLAEQEQPVRRRVALKIIKLGMDTKQVIARFEAERQALAMMDHPHIARVLDAGATDTGRPYFVMELVRGVPITEFCDGNNLAPQQRLELFVAVCQAVQHAHQKGIIHRDIKPTNVLVSRHDDKPVVKVIDFGIAKATGGRLTEKTVFTELRQMIGTPAYMSPEQAGLSDLDIDTRSDIYSLGVLLYELLTGSTPFDMKTLLKAGYAEIQRMIREVEPPRPSTRLSTMKDALPSVAAQRKTEPARLTRLVRGDLDWIVMKCLEKDRTRRYETANGLAADIQRYLGGDPVVAAPPSAIYRFQKFVRRHRAAVFAASLTSAALVLGIVGTSYGLIWAIRERDRATQEAARAKALNDFMQHMVFAADPENAGNREVTVAEMLMKGSEKADKTLKDQPIAEGEARTFLAATLRALGKIDEAEKEAKRALELRDSDIERNTLKHAESLRALAQIHMAQGEYARALEGFQRALAILQALQPQRSELCTAYQDVAQVQIKLGQFAEAEKSLDEGEEAVRRLKPNDLEIQADYLGTRASIEMGLRGDLDKAEALQAQELALRRQLADVPLLADTLNSLATVKLQKGDTAEALKLYEECLAIQRKEYGETHQIVAITLENTANVYFTRGDLDQALERLERVIAIRTQLFGADSFPVARSRLNMGILTNKAGNHAKALDLIDGALVVFRRHLGDKHVEVGHALRNRGFCKKQLGDLHGALEDARAALAIYDAAVGPTERGRLRTVGEIIDVLCLQGEYRQATELGEKTIRLLDPKHESQRKAMQTLREKLDRCRDGASASSQPASRPVSPPAGGA